jgi:hypothetical protein
MSDRAEKRRAPGEALREIAAMARMTENGE